MIYLIHFDKPYKHARHYLGYTKAESVDARLARHRAGHGARLLKRLNEEGIGYNVVRTWEGGQVEERKLKRRGGGARLCPVCKAIKELDNGKSKN